MHVIFLVLTLTALRPAAILMVQAVAAIAPRKRLTQMPDIRFPVEVVEGVPVVGAPEEIDITNATDLRAAMLEAAAQGQGTLVVDMTRTRFCDSAGLHTLVSAHRRAHAEGGAVLLAVTGTAVLRILAITSIDRVIPSFASLEEALAHAAVPPDAAFAPDAAVPPPQPSGCA
jgi:anti-sigma B factor antagonist